MHHLIAKDAADAVHLMDTFGAAEVTVTLEFPEGTSEDEVSRLVDCEIVSAVREDLQVGHIIDGTTVVFEAFPLQRKETDHGTHGSLSPEHHPQAREDL